MLLAKCSTKSLFVEEAQPTETDRCEVARALGNRGPSWCLSSDPPRVAGFSIKDKANGDVEIKLKTRCS